MSEQTTGAAFPVGARVRERDWPKDRLLPREGVVVLSYGDTSDMWVRWDGEREPDTVFPESLEALTPPDPPRAAERVLAPGIVVSADTCDGKPRLAGSRMPTDTARSWPDFEAYRRAYPHIRQEQYERAACFEAGRRWAKERRKAKRKGGGAPT